MMCKEMANEKGTVRLLGNQVQNFCFFINQNYRYFLFLYDIIFFLIIMFAVCLLRKSQILNL